MRRCASSCVLAALLFAVGVSYTSCALSATREDAVAALADAGQALRSAFVVVSDAERAGANTTMLIENLMESGSALTAAEVAFGGGNYSDAITRAAVCKALADSVLQDAAGLKGDAIAAAANSWTLVVIDVVGAVVFLVILFLVWRWFSRVQRERLLRSRPEVKV